MVTWARQRQFSYIFGLIAFFFIVGLILFLIYQPKPTCFDSKQNQNEAGIDCGGVCVKACASQARDLKIYWVRPLLVSPGWYDLSALVENLNSDLGARAVPYTFFLYDVNNVLIAKRSGLTYVNPGEKFAIFKSRIDTGERVAQKAFLEFSTPFEWEKAEPMPRTIYLEKKGFVNTPKPELHYTVTNGGLRTVSDLQLTVLLSDINNNSFAASATKIDKLEPNAKQEIYFTWPTTFANEPTYIDTYWRLNTFTLTPITSDGGLVQ